MGIVRRSLRFLVVLGVLVVTWFQGIEWEEGKQIDLNLAPPPRDQYSIVAQELMERRERWVETRR